MLNRLRGWMGLVTVGGMLAGCNSSADKSNPPSPNATRPVATQPSKTASADAAAIGTMPAGQWKPLFDGKTLKNWKMADFGGSGDPEVKDGNLIVPMGATLSGVTWTGGPLPTMNYEITLDAQRVTGNDFFCGLTFPYQKSHATLVIGGWGGSLVGISSIDGNDAANNNTATSKQFENKQWYAIRLRITPGLMQAWIDEEQVVDAEVEGHEIDTRPDIDLCEPLGLATYQSTGAYRNIRIRTLPESEQKKPVGSGL